MRPRFEIVEVTNEYVLIEDTGLRGEDCSITQAAHCIVEMMSPLLGNRRLEYLDRSGHRAEILFSERKFVGFGTSQQR